MMTRIINNNQNTVYTHSIFC